MGLGFGTREMESGVSELLSSSKRTTNRIPERSYTVELLLRHNEHVLLDRDLRRYRHHLPSALSRHGRLLGPELCSAGMACFLDLPGRQRAGSVVQHLPSSTHYVGA